MGDRTSHEFWIQFKEPATNEQAAVMENIIEEITGWSEYVPESPKDDPYCLTAICSESTLDTAEEVADALHEQWPDAYVRCWSSPKYEWLGLLTVWQDGEKKQADCGQEGEAVYTIRQLLEALERTMPEMMNSLTGSYLKHTLQSLDI